MICMWEADLKLGLSTEFIIFNEFLTKYPKAERRMGYFKEYDFTTGEFEVEVKHDQRANDTGNICIETSVNGIPSGITTSTAKYWVFYINHKETRIATPQEILEMPHKRITFTIKGNVVEALLIKKELIPIMSRIP